MTQSTKLAPINSMIVILDPENRVEVPTWLDGPLIASTETCILCACYPEVDGETEFVLGSMEEVNPGGSPMFYGLLKTPNRKIALETVECQPILGSLTMRQETKVRIWLSDARFPDKVIVGID